LKRRYTTDEMQQAYSSHSLSLESIIGGSDTSY